MHSHVLSMSSSHLLPPRTIWQSYTTPSFTMCPEQSAKGFTSMKVACLVASGYTGQRKPIEIMIHKKVPNFSTKSPWSCSKLGIKSLGAFTSVLMWFNRDDTLTDSSVHEHTAFCLDKGTGVSSQGSSAVRGHPILEDDFPQRDISVFGKVRLC